MVDDYEVERRAQTLIVNYSKIATYQNVNLSTKINGVPILKIAASDKAYPRILKWIKSTLEGRNIHFETV